VGKQKKINITLPKAMPSISKSNIGYIKNIGIGSKTILDQEKEIIKEIKIFIQTFNNHMIPPAQLGTLQKGMYGHEEIYIIKGEID
jgi:hypothetical protein